MRTGISITVSRSDRQRLEAIIRDRTTPQKHVWRARIVALSAEGLGTAAIMRETGKSKTCIWRWQERFMEEGVDGLLRDKTRPPRIAPLGPEVAKRPFFIGRPGWVRSSAWIWLFSSTDRTMAWAGGST